MLVGNRVSETGLLHNKNCCKNKIEIESKYNKVWTYYTKLEKLSTHRGHLYIGAEDGKIYRYDETTKTV